MTLRRFILFTVAMALALAASAQDATFELLKPRNVVKAGCTVGMKALMSNLVYTLMVATTGSCS